MASNVARLRFDEAGWTGLPNEAGWIFDEEHPRLSGGEAPAVFRKTRDNNPLIFGFFWALEAILRNVTWDAKAASDRPSALREAAFLESCMHDMETTWEGFLSEAVEAGTYGWASFEKLWKVRRGPNNNPRLRSNFRDGRIGWRDFAIRSQESWSRWSIDKAGRMLGWWQWQDRSAMSGEEFLEANRLLHIRFKRKRGNPEGQSLLRGAVSPDYYIRGIEKLEAIAIEKNLVGTPVVYYPAETADGTATSTQSANRLEAQKIARQLRAGESTGVAIERRTDPETGQPLETWDIKLLGIQGTVSNINTDSIIKRHMANALISVLADFLLLGLSNKQGSFALADAKTNIFAMSVNAILDAIRDQVNRDPVCRLFQFNNVPRSQWASLEHGAVTPPDLEKLSKYLGTVLKDAGQPAVQIDDKLEDHLRRIGNMPPRDANSVREIVQEARRIQNDNEMEDAARAESVQGLVARLLDIPSLSL